MKVFGRKSFFFFSVFFILLFIGKMSFAQGEVNFENKNPAPETPTLAQQQTSETSSALSGDLQACLDSALGIRFLCDPDWEVETDDDVVLLILSQTPSVTMTLARSDAADISLDKLDESALEAIGGYAQGFSRDVLKINDNDVIRAQGVLKDFPETQFFDHYFIVDSTLYSILFAIEPKAQYPNYQELIEKILNSVEIVTVQEPKEGP